MQLVRFTQAHGAYRGNETAGFSPDEAARLVSLGVAELCEKVRYIKDHGDVKKGHETFLGAERAQQLADDKVCAVITPGKGKGKPEPEKTDAAKPGDDKDKGKSEGAGAGSDSGSKPNPS